ncbi:hypothetical protein LJC40_06060 [Synergistaceae bacterium OttesenSCG-928-D05]|nr:hypothetical protein [Synergistaceae bacterium OttesenSCG-928-D05]
MKTGTKKRFFVFMVFLLAAVFASAGAATAAPSNIYISDDAGKKVVSTDVTYDTLAVNNQQAGALTGVQVNNGGKLNVTGVASFDRTATTGDTVGIAVSSGGAVNLVGKQYVYDGVTGVWVTGGKALASGDIYVYTGATGVSVDSGTMDVKKVFTYGENTVGVAVGEDGKVTTANIQTEEGSTGVKSAGTLEINGNVTAKTLSTGVEVTGGETTVTGSVGVEDAETYGMKATGGKVMVGGVSINMGGGIGIESSVDLTLSQDVNVQHSGTGLRIVGGTATVSGRVRTSASSQKQAIGVEAISGKVTV